MLDLFNIDQEIKFDLTFVGYFSPSFKNGYAFMNEDKKQECAWYLSQYENDIKYALTNVVEDENVKYEVVYYPFHYNCDTKKLMPYKGEKYCRATYILLASEDVDDNVDDNVDDHIDDPDGPTQDEVDDAYEEFLREMDEEEIENEAELWLDEIDKIAHLIYDI